MKYKMGLPIIMGLRLFISPPSPIKRNFHFITFDNIFNFIRNKD